MAHNCVFELNPLTGKYECYYCELRAAVLSDLIDYAINPYGDSKEYVIVPTEYCPVCGGDTANPCGCIEPESERTE